MFNTNFGNNSNNRLYTLNNFGNHRRSIKSSLLRSKNKNNKNKTNTEHNNNFNSINRNLMNNSDISNDSREQNIQEYKQLKKQRGLLIKKLYSKINSENITKEDFLNSSESVSLKFNNLPYDTYIIETKENSSDS